MQKELAEPHQSDVRPTQAFASYKRAFESYRRDNRGGEAPNSTG